MVLRVDPDNFEALRGMGFCYLERDQMARARQMLERAALLRPADAMVREALELLGARHEPQRADVRRDPLLRDDPWSASAEPAAPAGAGGAAAPAVTETPAEHAEAAAEPADTPNQAVFELVLGPADMEEPPAAAPVTRRPVAAELSHDPSALFDDLLGDGPLLGALLVDDHGLVHAGRLSDEAPGDAELIGAVMGGSVEEAARTAQHLGVGAWRGVLLEAERALLHVSPVGAAAVVILAARRSTPAGWLMRVGAQAAERAGRYLETYE
jgi:predicted regulator of Ras-like GTPase activity (Roadblock/LC7/MglB family)